MYQEVVAATASAKALIDLVRAAVDLKTRTDISSAIAAVQDSLLAAQGTALAAMEKNTELAGQVAQLRDELARVRSWAARVESYELLTAQGGAVVYQSTQGVRHFACPSCFERQQIQILQDMHLQSGDFECPGCRVRFSINPTRYRNI
jgi:hypothetical protein